MIFSKITAYLKGTSHTIRRFPLTVVSGAVFAMAGWTFSYLSMHSYGNTIDTSPYLKAIFASALGMILFTGLTLLAESMFKKRDFQILLTLCGIPILLAYYFLTPDFSFAFREKSAAIQFILLLFGFLLFFFLSPYLADRKNRNFSSFLFYAALRLLFTVVATIVVFAGINLALFSIEQLFSVDLPDEIYEKMWFLSVGIFALPFFLKGMPENFSIFEKKTSYPPILALFVKYALVPLSMVYLGILYVYLAKILITQIWPEGWVALPVLILGLFGTVTHVISSPLLTEKKSQLVARFIKLYYFFLIPLIVMLFTAFWKRIDQYGITELRYLGTMAGIWLLIIAAIYVLRPKNDIKILMASACAILIVSSGGPWGAFQVSENSQIHRLVKIMQETKNSVKIPDKTASDIFSIVEYLVDNHGIQKLDPLFSADLNKISSQNDWWEARNQVIQAIMTELNLKDFEQYPMGMMGVNEAYFQFDDTLASGKKFTYSLEGFDLAGQFNISWPCCEPLMKTTFYTKENDEITLTTPEGENTKTTLSTEKNDEQISIAMAPDGKNLIFEWGGEKMPLGIATFISDLRGKAENSPLTNEDIEFFAENDQLRIRLIFSYLNGEETDGILKSLNTQGIIFMKKKD